MSRAIVDVREPFEFSMGHARGAINIPVSKLMNGAKKLQKLPKNAEIILYCNSGSRSGVSASVLRNMGYTNVIHCINRAHVDSLYG